MDIIPRPYVAELHPDTWLALALAEELAQDGDEALAQALLASLD